uniref:MazG nucleotide pyrophosphohydrolase domain-containing protein n=1 Tax=Candidatus Kentrum sp. LPFa TaxID=2126335 RepID=A0A450WXQ4_9GAMM|nr:MAG: MazG nucleotide pyrophosphohydrolase domain-containing protein [Candidatus Kentron sp. LPFa]VFK34941.1 MAG: MazG nucleotide pyrophosphohydrolase domain-containing protein [Candidatus Kentron sp. LPFa]
MNYSSLLHEYTKAVASTDRLPSDNSRSVLMGLFGEVGGIMATVKKSYRERKAFAEYWNAMEEEFGDTLWYLAALCRRSGLDIRDVFPAVTTIEDREEIAEDTHPEAAVDGALLELGQAAGTLLQIEKLEEDIRGALRQFADRYLLALQAARIPFPRIVETNIAKVRGRFLEPEQEQLPSFDEEFPEEERLPAHFEIRIVQRKSGKSYMQWNGVFIGDPLTDNISNPDGYRFHDVFPLAHAAILHWSPTLRALIKHKSTNAKAIQKSMRRRMAAGPSSSRRGLPRGSSPEPRISIFSRGKPAFPSIS